MKQILTPKLFKILLGVLGALLLAMMAWRVLDVGTRLKIAGAVGDLKRGNSRNKPIETLLAVNDRARVLAALKEALEEEGGTIAGKLQVMSALSTFQERRPILRAFQSKNPVTRRAAASQLYYEADFKEEARAVALDWLRDATATNRGIAVQMVRHLKIEEAVPDLLKLLDTPPAGEDGVFVLRNTLDALAQFQPPGFDERLMAIAKDLRQAIGVRADAFRILGDTTKYPTEEIRDFLISVLTDGRQDLQLRVRAAGTLEGERFAGEPTWEAYLKVLLEKPAPAKDDNQNVLQRQCLQSIRWHYPFDRLRALLHDERVYHHPYFGIRIDVAAGLAALGMRDKLSFDILCEYLVDEDKRDTTRLIRQEAWLSLWTLTGLVHGVQEANLFLRAPAISDPPNRERLWYIAQTRFAVSEAMVKAVKSITPDLEKMKAVRQTYMGQWGDIESRWKSETERTALLATARDEKQPAEARAEAIRGLGTLAAGPVSEARLFLISILTDPKADTKLRIPASAALRNGIYRSEEAWTAWLKVLLEDPAKENAEVQQACLRDLGAHYPADRLPGLLRNDKVCRHPHFGIRADVAAGAAALGMSDRKTLELLCDYLTETDPADKDLLVPQEAWLSLWTLTAKAPGAPAGELFAKPPAIPAPPATGDQIWATGAKRPGVSEETVKAVKALLAGPEARQAARKIWLE